MSELSEQELAKLRERIHEMAHKAEDSGDPLAWFEDLYRISERDDSMIPMNKKHLEGEHWLLDVVLAKMQLT